jgi:HK97 family phage portal protein
MGIIDSIFKPRNKISAYSVPINATLPRVFPASSNPTYLNVINAISNTIASLDIGLYQRNAEGTYRTYSHPLCKILERPNIEETISVFLARIARSYLETGNVFLFKTYGVDKNINSLTILDSNRVVVTRTPNAPFCKVYSYSGEIYTDKQVLHIFDPNSYDNYKSHGAIERCKDIVDLDSEILSYIEVYFSNSLGKRIGIELPPNFEDGLCDENEKRKFNLWLNDLTTNSGKAFTLPANSKVHEIDQTTNAESDLKSLKERTEREICKLFNFPYARISGDYGNNLQNQNTYYYQATILPITEVFTEALNTLLLPNDAVYMKFKFGYSNLLLADENALHKIIREDVRGSLITPNEARKMLGYDRYNDDAADRLQVITQLTSIEKADTEV